MSTQGEVFGFSSEEGAKVIQKDLTVANPQMAMHHEGSINTSKSLKSIMKPELDEELSDVADLPSWSVLTGEPHFKVGVLVYDINTSDVHLAAIGKPASSCVITSLVVLNSPPQNENPYEGSRNTFVKGWLESNFVSRHDDEKISLGWGAEGYQNLLRTPTIDAIYIIVPPGYEREYVLAALAAGKHILLNDPLSTSLDEFVEQQECAKQHQKFFQFVAMFVHQYRTGRFMDRVVREDKFGHIHSISANLQMNYNELEKVGVQVAEKGSRDGCIRVLGRFCVLVSTLMFSRVGSNAVSAKVLRIERGPYKEIISAECIVHFTQNRTLTFDVGYTNNFTRQSIEVKSDSRYATMTDFVLEHPDGLASYRVYDKRKLSNGKESIVSGEAIDVAGGFSQDVMMWRTFVHLSHQIDKAGWEDCQETASCRELAHVALQTKQILIALLKSIDSSFQRVELEDV